MFRNIELKRRTARLCLFLTIFTFLVNCLVSGVVEVEATSNDRRQTYINLAKGKSATEMEEIQDMKIEELQCIALYLTNFYKTWNTRLNLEAANVSGEGYNDEYDAVNDMMTSALSDYCGFDEDTARYISALCLQYNIGTRQQLYIKKDHVKAMYVFFNMANAMSGGGQFSFYLNGENSSGGTLFDNVNTYANLKSTSLGFIGAAYYKNPSFWDYDSDQSAKSWVGIDDFEAYCDWLGVETIGGIDYVPLTYPIFMNAMNLSYRISCRDTTADYEEAMWNEVLSNVIGETFLNEKDTWLEDIYIRRPDINGHETSLKNNGTSKASSYTSIISFYWNDNGNMTPAFSTSNECMKMYGLINDNIDYKNGYGSAFLSCTSSEISGYITEDKAQYLTALNQRMYTNWVGDLLVDNLVDLYTIFPGCANPYMLTRITDSLPYSSSDNTEVGTSSDRKVVQGNRLCFLNVHSLVNSNKVHLKGGDSELAVTYATNVNEGDGDEYTLWETPYYTEYLGSSHTNWDNAGAGSFGGVYEEIYNYLDEQSFLKVDSSCGKDSLVFPSWWHIFNSSTSNDYGTTNAAARNNLNRLGNAQIYTGDEDNWWTFWADESKQYRSKYNVGVSRANMTVIAPNNLKGLKENQPLSEFFQTGNIFLAKDKFASITTSSYSSINDTKVGYSKETKAFFQPLFLTYCFAYFNSNATSFDKDTNILNLKMQTKYFPKGSDAIIDWTGIEISKDETANEVLSFTYYLLHPVEGIKYVATWLKNKIGGIFIGWHEDIVGSSDSNSSLGMTQYLGFSGYVTTPNLSDIGWIDTIVANYNNIVIYVLIFMAIIMLTYIIVGQLTVQRAIIGFILFGFSALLPPIFINTTISVVNTTCDSIYSSKFDYWAIVQTEEYLGRLQSYKDAENKTGTDADILASILAVNNSGGIEGETGYTGMRVKWISPKKFNDMAELTESMTNSLGDKGGVLQSIVINSIASTTSGETYLGSDNALYLYRDILDIYRYGSISYNIYSGGGAITDISFTNADIGNSSYFKVSKPSDSIFYRYWIYNSSPSDSNRVNTYDKVWNPTNGQVSHLSTIYDSSNLKVSYDTSVPADIKVLVKYNAKDYKGIYYRLASNLKDDSTTKDIPFLQATSSLSALRNGFINNKFNGTLLSDIKNYYTQDNLALTLLATYSGTYRTIGMHRLSYLAMTDNNNSISLNDSAMPSGSSKDSFKNFTNNYIFAEFPEGFNYSLQALQGSIDGTYSVDFNQLSHFYYSLYSESPYYFMNYEFRDILDNEGYIYDPNVLIDRGSGSTDDGLNTVVNLFLKDKQSYFYNYSSGDGYGELKDFMNMHDFFYYVLPAMKTGVQLVRDFDDDFGFYTYDTCPLRIQTDGSFKYNGMTIINAKGEWVSSQTPKDFWLELNAQQRYEFWHDLNVNLLSYNYCSYLDTMYDCDYADAEYITVMGEKFLVADPLDPMTYFETDDSGNVTNGRYMVFSRSEMAYYGLNMSDLTQVEKKIIDMQDAVYKEAISLTNYYNLSNETLIHNYCLLQLFEFNKAFSQDTLFGESFTLYPQGYELKATSYDGYLRLILSGSTGEDLMTDAGDEGNTSIYERIMKKTSIFFGLLLIANDFIAVYAIPALKLFFLIIIFFISILIIVASALKVELNIINVLWKSLISPMIFYAGVSVGLAWIVSLFMSNGSVGVTQDSVIIQLGDPTMTILVMLIINIVALILYWKICKKCFADFKKYITAIYHDIFGAVAGTFGKIVGAVTSGRYDKGGSGGFSTPKQRGSANNPKSGKSGTAGALVAGGVAGAVAGNAAADAKEDAKKNKYNSLADKAGDKASKLEAKSQNLAENQFKGVNQKQEALDGLQTNARDQLAEAKDSHSKALAEVSNNKKALDKANSERKAANEIHSEASQAYKNNSRSKSARKDLVASSQLKSEADKNASSASKQYKASKGKLANSQSSVDNAKSRLNRVADMQNKLNTERDALANDKKYVRKQSKLNKKSNKLKAKQAGLNAKGLNKYKVAAAVGMGSKAAAKGVAKGTGKALKNGAKLAGKATVATAKTVGNAASTTAKATVNALADNVVESTRK